MDPTQPFNPMFITQEFQSYVKADGDINGTLPIMSKVNLTCFYPGKKMQLNPNSLYCRIGIKISKDSKDKGLNKCKKYPVMQI